MSNHQMTPQQLQTQIAQLGLKIASLRSQLLPVMNQHEDIRSQLARSNQQMQALGRRFLETQDQQRQLVDQRNALMARSTGPPQASSSPSIGLGFGPGPQGGVALAPGVFDGLNYGASSPRGSSFGAVSQGRHPSTSFAFSSRAGPSYPRGPPPSSDPDATPRPRPATLQQQTQQQPQQQQQHALATTGSKNNADYLPMVIENILYEQKNHTAKGTLRTCNNPTSPTTSPQKCLAPCFSPPCFRAGHFHYCRKHMRIILGGSTVCSHKDKDQCAVVVWEERQDWEAIVDGARAARNLGWKGVDVGELKEGLFPPEMYPGRYM